MLHDANNQPDDPLLDQQQIIAFLGISRTQFWRIRRSKDFPEAVRLTPATCRWWRSDLINWLRRKDRS